MFYYDYYYFILVIPALLLGMLAQYNVNSTFNKYSERLSRRGLTGAEVARKILDDNGLRSIAVTSVSGKLTDHYDPTSGTIRLSSEVYGSTSIAAIGVAAHEAGHAIQYSTDYTPIVVRNAIVPVVNIGSKLYLPLILLGFFFSFGPLITLGILAFSLIALFQLVTLPVEFDASKRALATLDNNFILEGDEIVSARKVLNAAAMTYVAALIASLAQLLRLVLLFARRRD